MNLRQQRYKEFSEFEAKLMAMNDDEYEAWMAEETRKAVERGDLPVSDFWLTEMRALEATLTEEEKAAYARYLEEDIDPRRQEF